MSVRIQARWAPAEVRPGARPRSRTKVPRLVRFGLTGGMAGIVQLGLLRLFEAVDAAPVAANALGFLVAAQLNFAISQLFTWADRPLAGAPGDSLSRRWLRFHVAIAGTALLNMLVFAVARTVAPDLVASALGIGVAGIANFVLADRLVFRAASTPSQRPADERRLGLAEQRRAA